MERKFLWTRTSDTINLLNVACCRKVTFLKLKCVSTFEILMIIDIILLTFERFNKQTFMHIIPRVLVN